MRKTVAILALLFASSANAVDNNYDFCIWSAEKTSTYYSFWIAGMSPKDIKPAILASINDPTWQEIFSQSMDATYLAYHNGRPASWTENHLKQSCEQFK